MKVNLYKLLFAVLGFGFALTGCKEDIDMSNRYTFTGETVTDYIANRQDFSEYYRLIKKVPLSDFSKSSVAQLLSARGNFVVFAPTNEAIAHYLCDSVAAKGIVPDTLSSTQYLENENLADSLERIIVYNSIINRGDNVSSFWYIGDMCRDRYSELPVANMNGRYLTVENPTFEYDSIMDAEVEKCRVSCGSLIWDIRNRDVEVFNGVIQEMNNVVAPSNDNIFEILIAADSQYKTWAALMEVTGISAELTDPETAFEDYEYKKMYEEGVANFSGAQDEGSYYTVLGVETEGSRSILPAERKFGFTIFAETDELLAGIGVNGADQNSLDNLANKLEEMGASGTNDHNYKSDDNIIHQWLTYHILPMRMNYDQLVVHWNEQGYYPYGSGVKTASIPVSEWYQTYGKPYRLLKLTDGRNTGGMRINRFWKNNPSAKSVNDFEQEVYTEGTFVNKVNTQALNGLIYQIDELLVYSDEAAHNMGKERIRFSIAALLPEMMSNNLRRLTTEYTHGRNMGFSVKNSKNIQYFDRFISNNENSRINYLPGVNSNWKNMQGDEFNVEGSFDLTIQLPPVPVTTTYELRYGVSANNMRTMCQVYFGTNKQSLPATGIPMDLRTGGVSRYASTTQASNLGWVTDGKDDAANQELDKILRNNGYMKGPATYLPTPSTNFSVESSLREVSADALRCILVRKTMEAGQLYYVRFKDVLGKDKAQFFFDYMELCPKDVFDNPNEPEDKW